MEIKDLNLGDKVNYSSIAGRGVTSENHEVTHLDPMPNNFGCDVAWVTGKSGCVDVGHLSLV